MNQDSFKAPTQKEQASLSEIGLRELLEAEGGCLKLGVGTAKYLGRTDGTRSLAELSKAGEIVCNSGYHGQTLVPRWQFDDDGKVLPGFFEALRLLKKTPGADELLPFT